MSVIGNNILAGASGQGGGYVIDRSLRFRASASAYLNRTPASAGNRRTWTWSGWVKRGRLGTDIHSFFGTQQGLADVPRAGLQFESGNTLTFFYNPTGSSSNFLTTAAVFRDVSAWYHIILSVDTTQATASNRLKLYVNGVQVTSFGTANYPSQNADLPINATTQHIIGSFDPTVDVVDRRFYDGYLTEVNFIDGQALTPDSFGEYNEDTGVWQPKAYAGTYGTNGFYLNFSDPTSTTTLTADQSGNGNNWTANNISLTSGATYDSMIDTPTPVADVRGNFCVLNPIDKDSDITLSSGNLNASQTANAGIAKATFGVSTGKWYWEITATSAFVMVGIARDTTAVTDAYVGSASTSYGYFSTNGFKYNSAATDYGASYTTNDVIGVALDLDAGTLTFYKNNVSQGTAYSSLSGTFFPAIGNDQANTCVANFGQRPFAYTPPSGFKALHTGNLPEPAIVDGSQYFDAVTYTGNGGTQSVTGFGCKPEFLWLKCRSFAHNHLLFDEVRGKSGANYRLLFSNLTNAETTYPVTAINSDGFTVNNVGGDANAANENGLAFVAWGWKANGAGVSNTDGSITSTVSANPTAGFSIVTYTGNGSTGQVDSVGHGLGVAPKLYFIKQRNDVNDWYAFTSAIDGGWDFGLLNTTQAFASTNQYADSTRLFLSGISTNASGGAYVAYCFAEVPGYSRFGSYTGNGSADGPMVFTGFRPRWIMVKAINQSGAAWEMIDTARNPFNAVNSLLRANSSGAEITDSPYPDILSNGFKPRSALGYFNDSGISYIYAAFSESPFKYSLAR